LDVSQGPHRGVARTLSRWEKEERGLDVLKVRINCANGVHARVYLIILGEHPSPFLRRLAQGRNGD